jgi:nitrogen-specific signal transduction histidine kinase/CheY-like chemotaxis protein
LAADGGVVVGLVVVLGAAVVGLGVAAWRLRRQVRALESRLAEAQAQLGRLQRLASLGEMASSFAHAFNDVLTPIIGRTQLLAQRLTDPQAREWLGTIERAALSGAQTVRRIQEFMRERRQEPLEPVDLDAVVRQAVAALDARAVRVDVQLNPVPAFPGDAGGLREAIGHLLDNALQATPEGRVTVSTALEDGQAVVRVRDSGPGMTPEVQARIFEPFFTTRPGATGLGLCLAQGIVARHGGQLTVDSAPGRGTTVSVVLPVAGGARSEPREARPAVAGGGGPVRCLVVDDDPDVREMLRDILSNAGHVVVTAADGADGVERFKADPAFDVVITDLAMPKLNGLQLARVCKTLRPSVPVVMLTGWGVLLNEDELAEHGVDEVLSKPVRMDQVIGTIAAARARAAAGVGGRR